MRGRAINATKCNVLRAFSGPLSARMARGVHGMLRAWKRELSSPPRLPPRRSILPRSGSAQNRSALHTKFCGVEGRTRSVRLDDDGLVLYPRVDSECDLHTDGRLVRIMKTLSCLPSARKKPALTFNASGRK
eukprot:2712373-Rhodomonas_salina.1